MGHHTHTHKHTRLLWIHPKEHHSHLNEVWVTWPWKAGSSQDFTFIQPGAQHHTVRRGSQDFCNFHWLSPQIFQYLVQRAEQKESDLIHCVPPMTRWGFSLATAIYKKWSPQVWATMAVEGVTQWWDVAIYTEERKTKHFTHQCHNYKVQIPLKSNNTRCKPFRSLASFYVSPSCT